MQILNVTPDSFSDGGRSLSPDAFFQHAQEALQAGASYLDIGAESSRPQAVGISSEEERQRLKPYVDAVTALRQAFPHCRVSIDTVKPSVARWALETGFADFVNDVSGGTFKEVGESASMFELVAEHACPYVLMHRRGTPETMDGLAVYGNVVADVTQELQAQLENAFAVGVKPSQLIVDVGIGFAKTQEQNFALLRALPAIKQAMGGFPMLLGVSRKRVTSGGGRLGVHQREATTAVLHQWVGREHPAGTVDIFRVHDVLQQKAAWDLFVDIVFDNTKNPLSNTMY
jgi:dihydropteroate synthase